MDYDQKIQNIFVCKCHRVSKILCVYLCHGFCCVIQNCEFTCRICFCDNVNKYFNYWNSVYWGYMDLKTLKYIIFKWNILKRRCFEPHVSLFLCNYSVGAHENLTNWRKDLWSILCWPGLYKCLTWLSQHNHLWLYYDENDRKSITWVLTKIVKCFLIITLKSSQIFIVSTFASCTIHKGLVWQTIEVSDPCNGFWKLIT